MMASAALEDTAAAVRTAAAGSTGGLTGVICASPAHRRRARIDACGRVTLSIHVTTLSART